MSDLHKDTLNNLINYLLSHGYPQEALVEEKAIGKYRVDLAIVDKDTNEIITIFEIKNAQSENARRMGRKQIASFLAEIGVLDVPAYLVYGKDKGFEIERVFFNNESKKNSESGSTFNNVIDYDTLKNDSQVRKYKSNGQTRQLANYRGNNKAKNERRFDHSISIEGRSDEYALSPNQKFQRGATPWFGGSGAAEVDTTESWQFDVFLCHNSADKQSVKIIANELKKYNIEPWLDEWELRPGLPWQELLEEQIEEIKSAAVFVGKEGIGPWQDQEIRAFLQEFAKRKCPVIPVFLQDAPDKIPKLPIFLRNFTWVDFRKTDPNPMESLIWGITGKKTNERRDGNEKAVMRRMQEHPSSRRGVDESRNRIPIASSNIASIGYDQKTKILEVEFSSGSIYQYFDVPQAVHEGFIDSNSKGKYFATQIKDNYRYSKVK